MLDKKDIDLINETLAASTPVTGKYLTNTQFDDTMRRNNAGPLEPERTYMPYLEEGEKFNTGFNQFRRLRDVGDKIRIRIAGKAFVEGKHFFQSPDGWDVKPCVRANEKGDCQFCNVYFEALTKAKKTGDDKQVQAVKTDSKMKPFKCSLIVYYPVLDRNECKGVVFQTVMSVRDAIEAEAAIGVDTKKTDFIVLCTAGIGLNKYKVSKVDSTDNPPFSEEEKAEYEKAMAIELHKVVAGSADENSEVSEQQDTIVIDVDDKKKKK